MDDTIKEHGRRAPIGNDDMHIDVIVGPHPESEVVYIVDQVNPKTGAFDEHKCVMGCDSEDEARKVYMGNYEDGWKGLGDINAVTIPQFRVWLASGMTKIPFGGKVPTFGWYGVDLEGTLAKHITDMTTIGAPIPRMVKRIKNRMANGDQFRIVTARVAHDKDGSLTWKIRDWLKRIGLDIPVVATKDKNMIQLWDDKARQVKYNTGKFKKAVIIVKAVRHEPAGSIETNPDTGKTIHGGQFAPDRSIATKEQLDAAKSRGVYVPPNSWNVWVNPDPKEKVLAKWFDSKGRPQSAYSEYAIKERESHKIDSVAHMAEVIDDIDDKIKQDLKLSDATKDRVAAVVAYMIKEGSLRVGSEKYSEENDTYGASSLRKEHISVEDGRVKVNFTGKHHKNWQREFHNPDLADAVEHLKELPGERVFQYHGPKGALIAMDETKIRGYLKPFGVIPKQFRTYNATKMARELLKEAPTPKTQAQSRTIISNVVKKVSEYLGNTPEVCRGSYINPAVLSDFAGSVGNLSKSIDDEDFKTYIRMLAKKVKIGKVKDEDPFPDDLNSLSKSLLVIVKRQTEDFTFGEFVEIGKSLDYDHVEARMGEVKGCKHNSELKCMVEGIGGFKLPATVCKKCGRIRMVNAIHHTLASSRMPIFKALAEGCYKDPKSCGLRWITAHPNGGDTEGIPLLVHDNGEEYTVVGGAGGKMNQQVFKKPKGQSSPKSAIRKERRIEKKKRMVEELGEKGAQMKENAKALKEEARKQTEDLTQRVISMLDDAYAGGNALDSVREAAVTRAQKEHPDATPAEKKEFAEDASGRAESEAKNVARQLIDKALNKAAMRALGDDDGSTVEFKAKISGKVLVKKLTPDQIDSLVTSSANISQLKAKARAIERALSTGDQEAVKGIESDVRPLSVEEAKKQNLDKYINGLDVDNQTNLVLSTNAAPTVTRNRNQANGAMDGLNSFTSNITGNAILSPIAVKTLGVEDAARVAAEYLKHHGDASGLAEGLRDRIAKQSVSSVAAAIDRVREMDGIVQNAKDAAAVGDGAVTTAQASILAANMASNKYRFLNVARGQLRAAAALAHHLEHPSTRPLQIKGGSNQTATHALARSLGLAEGDYSVEKAASGEGGGYRIDIAPDKITKLVTEHKAEESDRNAKMDDLRQEVDEHPGDWHPEGLNSNIRLQSHQELAARAIVENKHVVISYGAGSGKTSVAYAAAADLISSGKIDKALISMPAKPKAQQGGPTGEASKFLSPEMAGQVVIPEGSGFKKALAQIKSGEKKIMVISPDALRNHHQELMDAGFGGEKSMFIADEAHRFAIGETEGSGSGMAKAAADFAKSEYASYMSGTLIENNSSELWSSLNSLFPGQYGSQKQFSEEWKRLAQGSDNMFSPEAMNALRSRLSGSMVSYFKDVKGASGEPLTLDRNTITVKTAPQQRTAIARINAAYRKEKAAEDPSISKAAGLRRDARIKRVLTAGVKGENGELINPKLEAVQKIFADEKNRDPQNRVGIYSFELNPLRNAGKSLKGAKLKTITGADDDKATKNSIDSVNDRKNDTDGVLLSNAANYGVNLQGIDHLIKMHPLDTPSMEEQLDHRHFRQGQTRNVRATTIMTDHPVEQMRQFRNTRIKLPEVALLSKLSDDTGKSDVLAKHLSTIEEAAGERL